MGARLERLTEAQKMLLPKVRDEWLGYGLANGPDDTSVTRKAITQAYRDTNLAPPTIWMHLDSPFYGAIGSYLVHKGWSWNPYCH